MDKTTSTPVTVGNSTAFTVQFDPASESYGDRSAIITITTNDPRNPIYTFTVEGTGIEPVLAGNITDGVSNIAGAYIWLYDTGTPVTIDRGTTSDINGYYEFFSIPDDPNNPDEETIVPGDYYLVIERDGFVYYTQTVTIP